jgi:serine/threonine protein kinase
MQINELAGYKAIRKIEKGGMTDLYVARNRQGERVVVRFIMEEFEKDRKVRNSFVNGVEILRHLDHPMVVKLLDYGQIKKLPYMAVEYHESKNLREMIISKDEVIHRYRLQLMRDLAKGLAYIHHSGYLHMDLKPENILIGKNLRCVYVDFDLSLEQKQKPIKLRTIPGTLSYLAPETLMNRMVEERSEVYSFGVAMYEMMTSRKPYAAESQSDYQRETCDPRIKPIPMSRYRDDIPSSLESVIMRCLSLKLDDRYPSMNIFLSHLSKIA